MLTFIFNIFQLYAYFKVFLIFYKNQSALTPLLLLFAKSHARLTGSVVNALAPVRCRCQLFCGLAPCGAGDSFCIAFTKRKDRLKPVFSFCRVVCLQRTDARRREENRKGFSSTSSFPCAYPLSGIRSSFHIKNLLGVA